MHNSQQARRGFFADSCEHFLRSWAPFPSRSTS